VLWIIVCGRATRWGVADVKRELNAKISLSGTQARQRQCPNPVPCWSSFCWRKIFADGTHVGCDTSHAPPASVHLERQGGQILHPLASWAKGTKAGRSTGPDGGTRCTLRSVPRDHGLQCASATPGNDMTAVDLVPIARATIFPTNYPRRLEGNLLPLRPDSEHRFNRSRPGRPRHGKIRFSCKPRPPRQRFRNTPCPNSNFIIGPATVRQAANLLIKRIRKVSARGHTCLPA